jgi:hypothetical protein
LSDAIDTSTATESAPAESSAAEESGNHVESDASDSFKPITSQADLDALLKGRLTRAEKAAEKKFNSRIAELEGIVHAFENEKLSDDEKRDKKLQELTAALAERENALQGYARKELVAGLADEKQLPRKFWDRVRGDTEEEISADIDTLLEALPKADKSTTRTGTVKVHASGDDGEKDLSAAAIIAQVDPNYKAK